MKKNTNTQKTIMFTSNNFEKINGFHEALGSKNFSDTVNILMERAFDNINSTNHIFKQFELLIENLSKDIKDSKEETIRQSNKIISIYNKDSELQEKKIKRRNKNINNKKNK